MNSSFFVAGLPNEQNISYILKAIKMEALEVLPEIPTTPFSQTTTLSPASNVDPLLKTPRT
jgi:hypothetical protein